MKNAELPGSPEWLAFDPEMSLTILAPEPSSFMQHYRTSRELKVLYLDGSSAVMTTSGTLDLQDVLIEGRFQERDPNTLFDPTVEYNRAQNLCELLFLPLRTPAPRN